MTFKLNTLIYLANSYSPIGVEDIDLKNHIRFKRRLLESYVGGKLKKKYPTHTFLLPIAISASMADQCSFDHGFNQWDQDDYTFISHSDEVWVLMSDGWKESVGVQAEIRFAKKIGKMIRYINSETLNFQDYYE